MTTVCGSIFDPFGRVFHITTVKTVHPLTILFLPASGWARARLPVSASRAQTSVPELTLPQSSEASHEKSFLPTFFERLKISRRRNASADGKLYLISINRAV